MPPASTTSAPRVRAPSSSNPFADFHLDDAQVRLFRGLVTSQYGIADPVRNPQFTSQEINLFQGSNLHLRPWPPSTYESNLINVTEALSHRIGALTYADLMQLISTIPPDTTREHSTTITVWGGRAFQTERVRNDAQLMRDRYRPRIEDLREDAQLEDILWSDDSETDFWTFVVANSSWRKALLGLVNNGNLRATWKGDDGSHLALQFLGDGNAEFVIFKQRPGSRRVSRVAGIDTLQGVRSQVEAFDLARLVYS